jgi:hypothetical protein
MTSLNSILPLIHDFVKSEEAGDHTGDLHVVASDSSVAEDAQFVLLTIDRLDKNLAASSRGELLEADGGTIMGDHVESANDQDDDVVVA